MRNTISIKKWIGFIALLTGALVLIDQFYAIGNKHTPVGIQGKINKIINHEINQHIVVFGSSVALVHFNPNLFENTFAGKSMYNAGIDGTEIETWIGLFNEFIENCHETKLVIFTINESAFSKAEGIYRPQLFYYHLSNENVYQPLKKFEPEIWKFRYIPFYKLTNLDKELLTNTLNGYKSMANISVKDDLINGFSPQNKTWDSDDTIPQKKYMTQHKPTSEALALFKEVIQKCIKKNIHACLIATPIYKWAYGQMENINQTLTEARNLSIETGVPFFDMSKDSTIINSRENFYNFTHMNTKGSTIFCKNVCDSLKKHKLL